MLILSKVHLPQPCSTFTAHLAKRTGIAIHPIHHVMTANARQRSRTFWHTSQYYGGNRSKTTVCARVVTRGRAVSRSFCSIMRMRSLTWRRMSSGNSIVSKRRAIALATKAGRVLRRRVTATHCAVQSTPRLRHHELQICRIC